MVKETYERERMRLLLCRRETATVPAAPRQQDCRDCGASVHDKKERVGPYASKEVADDLFPCAPWPDPP